MTNARRNVLWVLLLAVAIGVMWWRRDRTVDSAAVADAAPDAGGAPTGSVAMPALPGVDASVDASVDATRDPRERPVVDAPFANPPAIQDRMTDAHAHLQDLVKPCAALAKPKLRAHDQFRFGYRLTYRAGEARVSDVTIVWTDIEQEAVERCLIEKLEAARWAVTEPDWSTTVEDSLVGPELE